MTLPRVLTIAGSAAQGSAGIQADLKTFQERDVYGMSAITAIVANNAKTEQGIFTHPIDTIEAQVYAAHEHVGLDAAKTGMLFTEDIIVRVSELIKELSIPNIVVDPVMIGKMGSQLLKDDAIESFKEHMLPLAKVITPNRMEAARLTSVESIDTIQDMKEAAIQIKDIGPAYVLVKGGPLTENATDILYDGEKFYEIESHKIETIHTSGAGCTYSAAIASELAKGKTVEEAVQIAKQFITYAIQHSLSFNRGIGSTHHGAMRKYNK
ncbi:bifunctional hydroxymethylpyrimidine kinase/phosphomethylpyrimidine kinase [Pontibacillus marinus]|uniref:pyridoxal kinase n=1 Tax=Pontibacillus marinus BH030004 = DSM 16465 TaxID=1385511 RepID=A0A0A5GHD3_9BACI|nr:bifunctional hydroxymethylpyrimidine kinase/phosphomethylpyrimidine kinase [Pontibacillus marinus]KGX90633.1 pyridoxal kinase [Pontibacillus marinus BH030004 = DSM 16465]